MISREELSLLISGALQQGAAAIAAVDGKRLTRSETEELGRVFAVAMHMVADRCGAAKLPPPQPAARERRVAVQFDPLKTQELPRISDEDLANAARAKQK